MKYVQLGDRRASAIGLGTRQLGSTGYGWGRDYGEKEARQMVRRALEMGINLFDTAEWYAGGRSERILSDALGERRDQALIATKVSPHHLTRLGVKRAAERSLRRLGVGSIDLYQVHWPNPLIPLSWTMRGMKELMEEGLVRQVGVSNFSLRRWQRAERLLGAAVIANQVEYHLLKPTPLDDLVPYARRLGRVVIAYSPLAQGALTGNYASGSRPRGVRTRNSLFSAQSQRRRAPFMEELRSVARAHGATPAQIALAWLVHDPNVIAIPGAKSLEQVEANAAAADIALSDAEWQRLRAAALGVQFDSVGILRSRAQK